MRVRRLAFVAAVSLLVAGCGGSDAGDEAEDERCRSSTDGQWDSLGHSSLAPHAMPAIACRL